LLVRLKDKFQGYARDPDTSKAIFSNVRRFRVTSNGVLRYGMRWVISYHTIKQNVSGTISGSGGGNVTINLYKITTGVTPTLVEYMDTTGRTGNGTYSLTTYSDNHTYFINAYESSTLKGTSKIALPGTGFDIALASTSAVQTGYAGG
jgi:hypothetical protein